MIATLVTSSANAAQVLAFVAVILFIVCTIWALVTKAFYSAVLAAGFVFLAAAALWGLTG